MNTLHLNSRPRRLLAAIVCTLAIATGTATIALAADTVLNDTTEFRMRTATGTIEKLTVANLQPGQVLNLTTEAGTPVVVGRHENGYVLDLAGERFEVDSPELGEIEQHIVHHGDGASHDDGKTIRKIVRIKEKQIEQGDSGAQPKRKVMIVKHGDDGAGLDDLDVLIEGHDFADGGVPEGKRIVVLRKLEKQKTQD